MASVIKEDWDALLGENPRLPPDVHFRVTEEVFVNGSSETKAELVGAHKFVLAMASDVFKASFYGPMKEESEEIEVSGTTISAFKEFLRLIYRLYINKCVIGAMEAKPLFEILNLCKKYMVQEAVTFVETQISSMKLSDLNVVQVAIIADEYKELVGFETISLKLLDSCSVYLNESFSTVYVLRSFLAHVESSFSSETLGLIVRLLARANCGNCKAPKCLHGRRIPKENLMAGAKVKVWLQNPGEVLQTLKGTIGRFPDSEILSARNEIMIQVDYNGAGTMTYPFHYDAVLLQFDCKAA